MIIDQLGFDYCRILYICYIGTREYCYCCCCWILLFLRNNYCWDPVSSRPSLAAVIHTFSYINTNTASVSWPAQKTFCCSHGVFASNFDSGLCKTDFRWTIPMQELFHFSKVLSRRQYFMSQPLITIIFIGIYQYSWGDQFLLQNEWHINIFTFESFHFSCFLFI